MGCGSSSASITPLDITNEDAEEDTANNTTTNNCTCILCLIPLNMFNRTSSSICMDCRSKNQQVVVLNNIGCEVEKAMKGADRISAFVAGVDELRDQYFNEQILFPHVKKEEELNALV